MWFPFVLVFVYATSLLQCSGSKFYIDFEHPNITYINPKYGSHVNITAQRRSRRDPIHYVTIHGESEVDIGNDILIDIYVYEAMSNEFRRGFIEAHYKLCDILTMEKTFMPILMKYLPSTTCPFPKGAYHFVNMSLPAMPLFRTFPFSKGRLFVNSSNWRTKERVAEGYIDIFITEKV